MGDTLQLFPARVAIGQVQPDGRVLMTPDFSRAMADLLVRVGGPQGLGTGDLGVEEAAGGSLIAAAMTLAQTVADLQAQAVELASQIAVLSEVRKALADVETNGAAAQLGALLLELQKSVADLQAQAVETRTPTDWEHPGKIGASTANSGRFTTVNRVAITMPAAGATLTLTDGKTFSVLATLGLSGTDGATLNIGAGGTLGTAAYAAATAFAARSGTALGAAATDAATTQTLVNSIRSVLLTVGIGS